jgi:molecular chaperone GrpE
MKNSKEDDEVTGSLGESAWGAADVPPSGREAGESSPGEGPPLVAADPESAAGLVVSAAELEGLRKKAEERDAYRNELLRAMADLDNYQKRVRKDRRVWEEQAVDRVLQRILPVVDDFERALGAWKKDGAGVDGAMAGAMAGVMAGAMAGVMAGVQLTHQTLLRLLVDQGVEEIETQGKDFNPAFHDAATEEIVSTAPTGRILDVFQKGYRRGDNVLRASRVKVARNPSSGDEGS